MIADNRRVKLIDQQPTRADVVQDVLTGLSLAPKRLPSKLFYDARGSELFDAITEQPEYYLTRAEHAILSHIGDDLRSLISPSAAILELGSGSGEKTRQLLRHLPLIKDYIAVDISGDALKSALAALAEEFPDRRLVGLAADYLVPVALPSDFTDRPKLLVFFGSTLGNFEPSEAQRFLRRWARSLSPQDGFLVGIDLKKDPARLYRAYNDAAGITAAFNRNVLTRINRECAADFDEEMFRHEARYHHGAGRIEMFLISQRTQTVHVAGRPVHFGEGERILTEYSYKYSTEEFHDLAQSAGWLPVKVWTDPQDLFSLHYLKPASFSR